MKKICILIPTLDRPNCVKYFIEQTIHEIEKNDIDIYIYDSSISDETKKVYEDLDYRYKQHVYYKQIVNYTDKTTDLKVAKAFLKLQNMYDYIWLCGDGTVLRLEGNYENINKYLDMKHDLVILDNLANDNTVKEYVDGRDVFNEYGYYITFYGSTIVASSLLKSIDFNKMLKLGRNSGFLYWLSIFYGIAGSDYNIVTLSMDYYYQSPYKITNSSRKPGRFLFFWANQWPTAIDNLPQYYKNYKDKVCREQAEKFNLFSLKNLMYLRTIDNLNPKLVKEYRNGIRRVTDTPVWIITLVAYVPIPIVMALKKIYRLFK